VSAWRTQSAFEPGIRARLASAAETRTLKALPAAPSIRPPDSCAGRRRRPDALSRTRRQRREHRPPAKPQGRGALRQRPREPRRSLTLVDEVHETRDQPVTAARAQGRSTSPGDGVVRSGDEHIVSPLREVLEATDERRRRQACERLGGADTGDDGGAQ
jgi:hypothetical protein